MSTLHRIYVYEGSYSKLKSAKKRYNMTMTELSHEVIASYFNDDGSRKEARLSDTTLNRIRDISESTGRPPDDIVNGLIETSRILFSPDLSFSEAVRSIPNLRSDLVEKKHNREIKSTTHY